MFNKTFLSPEINSEVKAARKLSTNTMLTSKLSQLFNCVYVEDFFLNTYTYAQLSLSFNFRAKSSRVINGRETRTLKQESEDIYGFSQ